MANGLLRFLTTEFAEGPAVPAQAWFDARKAEGWDGMGIALQDDLTDPRTPNPDADDLIERITAAGMLCYGYCRPVEDLLDSYQALTAASRAKLAMIQLDVEDVGHPVTRQMVTDALATGKVVTLYTNWGLFGDVMGYGLTGWADVPLHMRDLYTVPATLPTQDPVSMYTPFAGKVFESYPVHMPADWTTRIGVQWADGLEFTTGAETYACTLNVFDASVFASVLAPAISAGTGEAETRAWAAIPRSIYERSTIVAGLFGAVGPEFDDLRATLDEIGQSTSVTNAPAWALALMEAEAGLPALPDASDADRRARLRAAGWRASGTATPARIAELAAAWEFGEIEITEDFANYAVTLKFVSINGEPADLPALQRSMRRVIPANLDINYEFSWFTWGDLRALGITWEGLRILDLTWAELGVYHTILFTDTFESGVGDWEAVSATVTQSNEQAKTGTYSLKVVTDNANPTEGAIRNGVSVDEGQAYLFTARVYGPATSFRIAWDENDGGGGYLRTKFATAAIPANTWTTIAIEATTGADTETLNIYVVPNVQQAATYYLDNPRIRRV